MPPVSMRVMCTGLRLPPKGNILFPSVNVPGINQCVCEVLLLVVMEVTQGTSTSPPCTAIYISGIYIYIQTETHIQIVDIVYICFMSIYEHIWLRLTSASRGIQQVYGKYLLFLGNESRKGPLESNPGNFALWPCYFSQKPLYTK